MTDTILKKWIKTRKGKKALIVASRTSYGISVGWSMCRNDDKFDIDIAHSIAYNRILHPMPVPRSILNEYEKMGERALRYFKA
jgi:hypothetical protein